MSVKFVFIFVVYLIKVSIGDPATQTKCYVSEGLSIDCGSAYCQEISVPVTAATTSNHYQNFGCMNIDINMTNFIEESDKSDTARLNSKIKIIDGLAKVRVKGKKVVATSKKMQQLMELLGNTASLDDFDLVGIQGKAKIQVDKWFPETMSGSIEVLIVKIRQYVQLYENEFSKIKLDMYITAGNRSSARIMFMGKLPGDNGWKLQEAKGNLCVQNQHCAKVHFCSASNCNSPTASKFSKF